jgi:hypothetical protein
MFPPSNFTNHDILDVESVWHGLNKGLMMHLDGLDFSGEHGWGKNNDYSSLEDLVSAQTTDINLVNILKWKSEWLVAWVVSTHRKPRGG